ncbi:MAG: DUF5702 domain-containing protein [Bacillota bacterium]
MKDNKGSITIFFIIIIIAIFSIFFILFNSLSIKFANNNLIRSTKLTSKNILADYDDFLYSNYNILAYKKEKNIKKLIKNNYKNFSSGLNLYNVKDVKITYKTNSILNKKEFLNQAIFFTKLSLGEEVIKELINQIKDLDKYKDIKAKMDKYFANNKYIKKIKKIQMDIKKSKINKLAHDLKKVSDAINQYKGYINDYKNRYDKFKKSILKYKNDQKVLELKENIKNQMDKDIIKIEKVISILDKMEIEVAEIKDLDKIILRYNRDIHKLRIEKYKLENKIYNLEYKKSISENTLNISKQISRLKKSKDKIKDQIDNLESKKEKINKKIKKGEEIVSSFREEYNKVIKRKENEISIKKEVLEKIKSKFLKEIKTKYIFKDYNLDTKKIDKDNYRLEDKVIFNEYILGNFNSKINPKVRKFNLSANKKENLKAPFEIEYICEGKRESYKNVVEIISKIGAIRLVMNLPHLFIDNEKREFILSFSKVPYVGYIISGGVSILWSTAESVVDEIFLIKNSGTPFLKIDDRDFFVDISLFKNISKLSKKLKDETNFEREEKSHFYYYDYLRLILISKNINDLANRSLEIIKTSYKKNMDMSIDLNNLILQHSIKVKFILENKLTKEEKIIKYKIDEGYIYE